jgi:transcriptional regulator with XRE-family HTH domain
MMMGEGEEDDMSMIEKIEQLRKSRGWSQDDLERKADLAKGRISKWLGGQGHIHAEHAWRLAKALAVDVVYLLDDEQDRPKMVGRDEFELCTQLMKKLGADEAFRRLALDDREGRAVRGEGPFPTSGEPIHGHEVNGESPRRRRGSA